MTEIWYTIQAELFTEDWYATSDQRFDSLGRAQKELHSLIERYPGVRHRIVRWELTETVIL